MHITGSFLAVAAAAYAPVPEGLEAGGSWGALIFFITVAIGLSFFCSILEAALLSTTASHVQLLVDKNTRAGRLLRKHKNNVDRPISAILTLNTVAHTLGATGAGVEAAGIFGSAATGLIGAVLTLLILVFSEIIPKTLGAIYWKQLSTFTAYSLEILLWTLYPAVWASELITRAMRPSEYTPTVSRADLEAMAQISRLEGALLERENRILKNLLHLRSFHVKDIMTPRTVVLAFQQDMTVKEVVESHPTLPYSRIPIYNENIDDVAGFVLRHDIYHNFATGEHDRPMFELRREILVTPETTSVARVLDEFIEKQEHILLVIDEYGGTAGIITMEDAIETLLGIEITDESDLVADLRKMAEQRYLRQRMLFDQVASSIPKGAKSDSTVGSHAAGSASD